MKAKQTAIIVRFRTRRQYESIKRMARKQGVSVNTYIVRATAAKAEQEAMVSAAPESQVTA